MRRMCFRIRGSAGWRGLRVESRELKVEKLRLKSQTLKPASRRFPTVHSCGFNGCANVRQNRFLSRVRGIRMTAFGCFDEVCNKYLFH